MKNPSSGVAKILRRGTNLIENNNYHYVIVPYSKGGADVPEYAEYTIHF